MTTDTWYFALESGITESSCDTKSRTCTTLNSAYFATAASRSRPLRCPAGLAVLGVKGEDLAEPFAFIFAGSSAPEAFEKTSMSMAHAASAASSPREAAPLAEPWPGPSAKR